jgi:hypothetical protein
VGATKDPYSDHGSAIITFEVIGIEVVFDRVTDEESFEQTDHHCGELEAQPGSFHW